MRCPMCKVDDTKVIDSRDADDGTAIRRRRSCPTCSHRFTTYERLEEAPMVVIKSSGQREPYERAKLMAGVTAATKGRPVSAAQIEQLADEVEERARAAGTDVTTSMLGHEVLSLLSELDEVGYMRFASVYKSFDGAGDFQRELVLLEKLKA